MATACDAGLILFSWLSGSILNPMPTHRQAGLAARNVTARSRLITVITAFSSSVRSVVPPYGRGHVGDLRVCRFRYAGLLTRMCPARPIAEGSGNQARNGVSHV